MRRAPVKIDERALERQKMKALLAQDEFIKKLAGTPLGKLHGLERLLAALYRQSDLFPTKKSACADFGGPTLVGSNLDYHLEKRISHDE